MNTFFADVRDTIVPRPDGKYGPLPPLMVTMTLVTGLVDAFSYLVLGHVFVANMTGNIVFVAFALVGAPGFSIPASLVALASFFVGAAVSGRLGSRLADRRDRLLSASATMQAALLAVSVVFSLVSGSSVDSGYRYVLIVVLGVAMGIQNAAARRLAVPDLTTTVLTLTITGIAADGSAAGAAASKAGRRMVAVATMLAGALLGAALVIHADRYYPLVIAFVAIVTVAVAARRWGRSNPVWIRS